METHETVLHKTGTKQTPQIAAFDLDGTLITLGATAGRKKAAAADASWEWWNPCVLDKLVSLNTAGYTVVIFSNQSGLSGKKATEQLKTLNLKIEHLMDVLGFKPFFYFASAHDKYRKPGIGMWELFLAQTGLKPNMKKSFYVGDAAGRPGDHAASDAHFAYNCGLQHYTPEAYFLDDKTSIAAKTVYDTHPEYFSTLVVAPGTYKKSIDGIVEQIEAFGDEPFAVFMCGPPASGKTSLAREIEKRTKSIWINQDTLKTKAKMFAAIKVATTEGKSVIIDKTFGDIESRKEYLEKIPGTYVRLCVMMNVKREQAEHLNWVRTESCSVDAISDIVYATYYKYFDKPSLDEGFSVILESKSQIPSNSKHVPFVARRYV